MDEQIHKMNDYDGVCSESENGEFNENIFLFVD